MHKFNSKNMNFIVTILLPGDGNHWPPADTLELKLDYYMENMSEPDLIIIDALGLALATASDAEHTAIMQAFEAREAALFAHFYRSLLDAYYSCPAVVARTEALANAAPRETSIHFDERLVETVIETKAGQYRT